MLLPQNNRTYKGKLQRIYCIWTVHCYAIPANKSEDVGA